MDNKQMVQIYEKKAENRNTFASLSFVASWIFILLGIINFWNPQLLLFIAAGAYVII